MAKTLESQVLFNVIDPCLGSHSAMIGPRFPRTEYPSTASVYYPLAAQERLPLACRKPHGKKHLIPSIENWPLGQSDLQSEYTAWYHRLKPLFSDRWESAGISHILELSSAVIEPDCPLMKAAALHWSSTPSQFLFADGPMMPSHPDIYFGLGLSMSGQDPPFHFQSQFWGNSFFGSSLTRLRDDELSYPQFLRAFDDEELDPELSHQAFLLLFLCRTFAMTKQSRIIREMAPLAEGLASGTRYKLAPLFLGAFFNAIGELSLQDEAFSCDGPIWFLPFWLYTYFPSLNPAHQSQSARPLADLFQPFVLQINLKNSCQAKIL